MTPEWKPGVGLLPADGHATFSPDGIRLVCDTYPKNPQREASLRVVDLATGTAVELGRFHHPAQYTGDIRCDLHPR